MKHSRRLMCIFCLAIFSPLSWGQGTAKIAVTDFENKAGADPVVVGALADMLSTGIVKSGKFTVVERAALSKVVDEQNFGTSGAVDPASAAEVGKMLGAEYVLIGVVSELNTGKGSGGGIAGLSLLQNKSSLAMDVRFIDCTTAEVKMAETFREERTSTAVGAGGAGFSVQQGVGAELAREIIDHITQKLMVSVYPPTVIRFDPATGQAAINYGDMMFKPGQRCDVLALGEVIVDPVTGKKLGNMESKIGEVEIVSADMKLTQAKLVSGEVREGSIVKISSSGSADKKPGGKRKR
jgi:curli biogenesis system outer membrane secretion channel CsgG